MTKHVYVWRPDVRNNHFRCCRCGKRCANRKGEPRECTRMAVDRNIIVIRCPRCGLSVCRIEEAGE